MSSTIRLKRSVLLALSKFSNGSAKAIEADDYTAGAVIRVTPERVLVAASNRACMYVLMLEPKENQPNGLVSMIDIYEPTIEDFTDEYIFPLERLLATIKGGNPKDELVIEHTVTDLEDHRGMVTVQEISSGVKYSAFSLPALFPHLGKISTINFAELKPATQIALAPKLLVKFSDAAKILEIPSHDRVVIAFTGDCSMMGVKAGLADWAYGVCMPFTAPTRYEGTTPDWGMPDTDGVELANIEEPEEVEQLSWDMERLIGGEWPEEDGEATVEGAEEEGELVEVNIHYEVGCTASGERFETIEVTETPLTPYQEIGGNGGEQ